MRNATGPSGMCRAHELVARDAARQTEERGGFLDSAFAVFDDLVAGRGVNREKVARAINEGIWEIGGGYTRFHPDLENVDFTESTGGAAPGATRERFRQAARNAASWFREEAPPPPDPPAEIERRRRVGAARAALGFGPAEPITADALRARHRELAKRHHPDRGGSVARMQEINSAVDILSQDLASP